MFDKKTLLITGGTGSFGNAVLRRFFRTDIKQIRIFSRDEKKQDDMRHEYKNPKLKFCVCFSGRDAVTRCLCTMGISKTGR